jgi:triphosphoribosyl-dephospho-CoA synthase
VRRNASGLLRSWRDNRSLHINDLFLEILMSLMAENEDTNVIIRGGMESLSYVKSVSREFLLSGGICRAGAKQKLESMNEDFIKKNISPGGSADLLAVSIFLGMMEGILK